jgi:hypothetical protein
MEGVLYLNKPIPVKRLGDEQSTENSMMNITPWGENTEEDILAFEKQIGFSLPRDYR